MERTRDPSVEVPLAVITGAAQRLGKGLASALAQEGYAVVLHYHHSAEQAEITAAELSQYGQKVYPIQADLTAPEEIIRLFDQIRRLPEKMKVLVNSASAMPRADLRTVTAEAWDAAMALNLRAPLLCSQQAARLMSDRGGVIVNISDAGSSRSWTGYPAYVISKSALETLTRLLARTLAPRIRVNAIAPGLILKGEVLPPEDWSRLTERVPLKRQGDPEEIGQALVFLIKNEYITGQTLVVDGGYQLL